MKSYTDLDQSKKLSDILPLESADMCYKCIGEDPYDVSLRPYSEWREEYKGLLVAKEVDVIPCWSLAALRSLFPCGVIINDILHVFESHNTFDNDWIYVYKYEDSEPLYVKASNEIDACYDMIMYLHKLNLL